MSVTFTQNDPQKRMHIPERIEPFVLGAFYIKRLAEENEIITVDEATETIEIDAEPVEDEIDTYRLPDGTTFKAVCTVFEATDTTPRIVRFEFPAADPKFKIGDLIASKYAFGASNPTVFKVAKVVPVWGSYNYYSSPDMNAEGTIGLAEYDATLADATVLSGIIKRLENEADKALNTIKLLKSFSSNN